MHEHHRTAQGTVLFEEVLQVQIVIVLKAHAAEDNHVHFGLQGDTGQEFVVRFTGDRENRELLRNHERVEHVDHRDTRTHHRLRDDTLGGVHGRTADSNAFAVHFGAVVAGLAGTVKHAAKQGFAVRNLHRFAKEAHFGVGGNTAGTCEHLQVHHVAVNTDHAGKGCSERTCHLGKFLVCYTFGTERNHGTGDAFNTMVCHIMH